MPLPYTLASLKRLCREHSTSRKVVFAPSAQGGRAVQRALAAAGVPFLNLEITTVGAHAEEWLPPHAIAAGQRALPIFSEGFLLDRLLQGQSGEGPAPRLPTLRETVETLRMAGLPDSDAGTVALDDPSDEARLNRLFQLALSYDDTLRQSGVLDGASVLRLATEHVREVGPHSDTVYAAFDETSLTPQEAQFVEALTEGGNALHRMGFSLPELLPPPATAEARFWAAIPGANHELNTDATPGSVGTGAWLGASTPPDEVRQLAASGFRFLWGVGAQAEVRAFIRDVLERGLRWDEVEVAYAANDPYLALLHAEVGARERASETDQRERLPATFAAGFPLRLTRTGHAMRGVLDWLEGGRDSAHLVRLLQGDLITFHKHPDADPHRAAHTLLEGGLGIGTEAHRHAIERTITAWHHQHRDAEEAGRTDRAERLALQLEQAEADLAALDGFAACFPAEPQTPAAFCIGFRKALLAYGPVSPELVEENRAEGIPFTHDEFALDLSQHRLHEFSQRAPSALDTPLSAARAARALRDALLGGFLNARAPRAGSLHVVPLSSAGLSGRPHLYIVGLDGNTAAPAVVEDAFLPDRDRERLDGEGDALPRAADAPRFQLWSFARALARITPSGTVTFCARTHAIATGDPLYPSSLLLRAAALAGRDLATIIEPETAQGLVPDLFIDGPTAGGDASAESSDRTLGRLVLHDAEADLAARRCPRLGRSLRLARQFPAAYQGVRAVRARAAAELTLHDGWLGRPHEELDVLGDGALISPSRLETLATCPHRYFLRHILGVEPPPEAPDPDTFIDARERGSLLHEVFEEFGNHLVRLERAAVLEDEPHLLEIADAKIEDLVSVRGEPAEAVLDAVRRDIRATARVFLRSEVNASAVPHACEQRFGFDRPVEVSLGSFTLRLRGIVDRVDRRLDGTFEVSDFKTGSTYGFPDPDEQDQTAALADGTKLQWALYAYALEDAFGWRVTHSGYRFPGEKAWGERRHYRVPDRTITAEVIANLARIGRDGFFPPAADKPCRFCDYARVCGDPKRRKQEIQTAVRSARDVADHTLAEALAAWSYK